MKRLLLPYVLAMTVLPACADQAQTASEVAMPDWVLDQIDGEAPAWRVTISLSEPGKISGRAPCNAFFAAAVMDGTAITLKPIAATKMACPDLAGEGQFFQALQGVTVMEQTAESLVLSGDGHQLIFVPAP